jgi:hypothetical protein
VTEALKDEVAAINAEVAELPADTFRWATDEDAPSVEDNNAFSRISSCASALILF